MVRRKVEIRGKLILLALCAAAIAIAASSCFLVPNSAPVADIEADKTGGIAPLSVHFDGTGSFDPDGSIRRYEWDCGDEARAIGAHLANAAAVGQCRVSYWRDRNREVDFIVEVGKQLLAVEVKSGRRREMPSGLAVFLQIQKRVHPVLVGGDGMALEEALSRPVGDWV